MDDIESSMDNSFISNIARLVQGKFIDIMVESDGYSRRFSGQKEMIDCSSFIEQKLGSIVRKTQKLNPKNESTPKFSKIKNPAL
jgi:hypothetical protein